MIFRDALGNIIEEGTIIAFPMAAGQAVPGRIEKIESGLGLDGTAQRQPILHVRVASALTADPVSGLVPGVFVIKTNPASVKE